MYGGGSGCLACVGNNCIESLIARDSNQLHSSNNIDLNGMSESLTYYMSGEWVFFQRSKESGGGYWLGRTYDFVFIIELPQPVSLHQGILFLNSLEPKSTFKPESTDDFKLQ